MKNSRDLILGEVIFIIYHIPYSGLNYRRVSIFRFDHMTGKNQHDGKSIKFVSINKIILKYSNTSRLL